MQLEHSFTVPVGVEDAWIVLLDIERIAPCLPGAAIDSVDGDDFTGTVKVKLGPIAITYKGKASFVEKDIGTHRVVIDARGRESRGNGTANAKITATLTQDGASTTVDVVTDLDITGKPAQFGRGVMVDVGNKLIGQFADCLAGKLADGPHSAAEPAPSVLPPAVIDSAVAPTVVESAVVEQSPPEHADSADSDRDLNGAASAQALPIRESPRRVTHSPTPQVEPINLIESAGPAIAKRLVPVVGAAVLLVFFLRWRKKN